MENLKKFATIEDFEGAYNGEEYIEPWVSYTVEGGAVNYNKFENWIEISYADGAHVGSSHYASIGDYGETFDNSENSVYHVYDEGTDTWKTYRGVNLCWDGNSFLYVNQIPCNDYYYIAEQNGNWVLKHGYMDCDGDK